MPGVDVMEVERLGGRRRSVIFREILQRSRQIFDTLALPTLFMSAARRFVSPSIQLHADPDAQPSHDCSRLVHALRVSVVGHRETVPLERQQRAEAQV